MLLRFKLRAAGKLVSLVAAFLVFSINSSATGVLDPTFGSNGRAAAAVGSGVRASAAVIQRDGKIVVVGDVLRTGSQRDVALSRFNANGTPDLSFGAGGTAVVAISNRNEAVNAAAIDGEGRIVVVGSLEPFDDTAITDFLVARFTPNGALDSSFGNGGVVITSQGSTDSLNAVAIQPNGRIIAAGRTSDLGLAVLIGLTSAGLPDVSFGGFGSNFFDVPLVTDEQVQAIALLPDGQILVGGQGRSRNINLSAINFLAKFDSDGSQSQNFGNQGIVTYDVPTPDLSTDFAVLPDGRILTVMGTRAYRFSSNGVPDAGFNGSSIAGNKIALRSDGKFVALGSPALFSITRIYTNNGRFVGVAGKPGGTASLSEVLVQSDDKIILIGSSETEFVVTRLIAITSKATRIADYDRDEKTDFAVFRRSAMTLFTLGSTAGEQTYRTNESGSFAVKRVIPETYDCGAALPFVYWMSGNLTADKGYFVRTDGNAREQTQWGLFGDVPVGGDYDGDGCTDFTVYRPSEGTWYFLQSSNNQLQAVRWGLAEDKPVPADYDYDGITDFAVYRPSDGTWYVRRSSDLGLTAVRWGNQSDIPLTGDFDGDGKADFVVYRPSAGTWYLLQTKDGFRAERFGLENDQPVPGDYDGDGRHDAAVFRNGNWYIQGSARGFYSVQLGATGDEPVSVRYDF